MTSQRVERTWIRTGGYGRFRGEWVKEDQRVIGNTLANFSFFIFSFFYLLPLHDRDSTEGIPEGFFDDPKLDAKVS